MRDFLFPSAQRRFSLPASAFTSFVLSLLGGNSTSWRCLSSYSRRAFSASIQSSRFSAQRRFSLPLWFLLPLFFSPRREHRFVIPSVVDHLDSVRVHELSVQPHFPRVRAADEPVDAPTRFHLHRDLRPAAQQRAEPHPAAALFQTQQRKRRAIEPCRRAGVPRDTVPSGRCTVCLWLLQRDADFYRAWTRACSRY